MGEDFLDIQYVLLVFHNSYLKHAHPIVNKETNTVKRSKAQRNENQLVRGSKHSTISFSVRVMEAASHGPRVDFNYVPSVFILEVFFRWLF